MPAIGGPPKRHKMVGWFDVPQLARTGTRVAISAAFGEFADGRETMVAARPIEPEELDREYRYAGKTDPDGSFWFDFVADTGEGWNSTYAVARLLADPKLAVGGLPARDGVPPLLIMGGDQVYPTADRDAYRERLLEPFDEAARLHGLGRNGAMPDVYAIPGNHDWYDGLQAFLGVFCRRRNAGPMNHERQGRDFGGRQTQQTRSYFALSLPHDWWIWGVDVQLAGYIDQPQVDFFTHVATEWMAPGSRVILCTGNPEWAYLESGKPTSPRFRNFDYVASLVDRAGRGHRLCAVLSGDSHHYARYEASYATNYEVPNKPSGFVNEKCAYITAGGGGAFLHPTHVLPAQVEFEWRYRPLGASLPTRKSYFRRFSLAKSSNGAECLFPSRQVSRALAWGNLKFPLLNWVLSLVMGTMWSTFAWVISFNADNRLSAKLAQGSVVDALCAYLGLIFVSPWPVLLLGFGGVGFVLFSDYKPRWWKAVTGLAHAGAHLIGATLLTLFLARCVTATIGGDGLLVFLMLFGGWLLGGLIFGCYLLLAVLRTRAHWNEAFSSLRIEGYKNFLRLRIGPDGTLTIYPIGLKDVPADRGDTLKNPPLSPVLIEPPIPIA